MRTNEYRCMRCGNVYEKLWSDEEALAELNEKYPGFTAEDAQILCDDCNTAFEIWFKQTRH
jgi:hypothetical protein